MKKINILLALSILGGSLLSFKNNSVPVKQRLMSTRSANIETYTTKKKNNVTYEITIYHDSKETFSNMLLIKLSSGIAVNTGMTSVTINQNVALHQYYDFLLADCQINGSITNNEISSTEFTAIEKMLHLISEDEITYSSKATKKAYTFSSSDLYMHSERLIENVSYPHTYNFQSSFINGTSYAFDGLIGSGYYITVSSVKRTYNFLGFLTGTKTNQYRIYHVEKSSIKMALQDGKVLHI